MTNDFHNLYQEFFRGQLDSKLLTAWFEEFTKVYGKLHTYMPILVDMKKI